MMGMVRLREMAFETSSEAQLVVDANNVLVLVNGRAREQFNISPRDVGRPFQDMEISYRPVELRSSIQRAYSERAAVLLKDIEWYNLSGESRFFDIRVQPLLDNGSAVLGASITFIDVTMHMQLQRQLEQANHELETALEELQSTNEELETTNEELQSTIEELETTNEELQSTNEELETMNEELQSTNEELQTINDELRQRTEELNQVNSFLEAILTSVNLGVVVVDKDLKILAWNRKAEDYWGLRADEVYLQNFLNLDIGLPVEQLKRPLLASLSGSHDGASIELPALNRRGKTITCRVSFNPLLARDRSIEGVIVLMDDGVETAVSNDVQGNLHPDL